MMACIFITPPQSPCTNKPGPELEAEISLVENYTETGNHTDGMDALTPFQLYSDVDVFDPARGQGFDDIPITLQQNNEQSFNVNHVLQDLSEQSVLFFDTSFVCPVPGCERNFTSTQSYRLHRVKFHRLPRFNCIVCLAPFDKYTELSNHMEMENHSVKCKLCPKLFRKIGVAVLHFNEQHKHFPCMHCKIDIYGRQPYKTHLKLYHVAEENSILAASSLVETTMNSSFISDVHIEEQSSAENDSDNARRLSAETEEVLNMFPASSHYCNSVIDSADCLATLNAEVPSNTSYAEEPLDTDSANTSGSVLRPTFEEEEGDTYSHRLFRNPFADPENSYPVIFGPGALDILEDTNCNISCPPSVDNSNESAVQWIGHNVDMFHDMSETHRRTYRYVCEKCSHSFTSKSMLQKHRKTHEFICKHCFLKYDTLSEYKNHLKEHISGSKVFLCSVCNFSLHGLKNLMVHEMRHRLNMAFKRKVEDAAVSSDRNECKYCKARIEGFSALLRHEVWHDWQVMWTSYVVGRIFKGVFTESDTKRLRETVENELIEKWRDGSDAETKSQSKNCSVPEIIDLFDDDSNKSDVGEDDDVHDDRVPSVASGKQSDEKSEGGTDVESELSEEAVSPAIKGWMSYWQSYLGLDNNKTPSWVMPILKELRLQWRNYDANEQETLYQRMDQIAILIRAERNETSKSEEPRVLLHRLPYNVEQYNKSSTQQCLTPKEVKVIVEKIPEKTLRDLTVSQERARESHPCGRVLRKSISACAKNLQVISCALEGMPPSAPSKKSFKRHMCSDSPVTSKARILRSTRSFGICTTPPEEENVEETTEITSCLSKQPVVVIPKLVWPIPMRSDDTEGKGDTVRTPQVCKEGNTDDLSSLSSCKIKMWIRKEIGDIPIPKWALPLLKDVWQNSLKADKIDQIRSLIRAEQAECGLQKNPVVKLKKL